MESKIVIFAVFASLLQCSLAVDSALNYGLEKKDWTTLTQITTAQEQTISGKFSGFNPLFSVSEKYAAALIYDFKTSSNDDSKAFAAGLAKVEDTLEFFLNAIQISLGKTSSKVAKFKTTVSENLKDSFDVFNSALQLAKAGKYSAEQPTGKFDSFRNKVRDERRESIKAVFEFIRTVLDTKDKQILSILDLAHTQSRSGIDHTTNAVLNGIGAYGAAVALGDANITLLNQIEEYRENGLDGVIDDVSFTFLPLRTIFLHSKLKLPASSLAALYANQVALDRSFRNYKQEVESIFGAIVAHLTEISLGFGNSGEADYSRSDAAAARSVAKLTAGYESILSAILILHPKASEAIDATHKTFATSTPAAVKTIFNSIHAARDLSLGYAKALKIIEADRKSMTSFIDVYIAKYYSLFRTNPSLDKTSDAQLTDLQKVAVDRLAVFADNLFNAIKLLAKATYDGTSKDDFVTIQKYENVLISALQDYTQTTSAAGVIALKAAAASS